jgi:thioredoxin 2
MEFVLLACPQCQTKNRVPAKKLGQTAKCGKCGMTFATPSAVNDHPITLTDANFGQEVLQSPLPVLVDVWAPWCGPCRMVAPVIEEIAREFAGRLRVGKLNSDENQMIPSQYHIQGIPTLLLFHNGQLAEQIVGAVPKQHIVQKLHQVL